MGDGKGRGKRSAEGKYGGPGKRAKQYTAQNASLPLNTRGFLVSCQNGKEWPASHEAIQLIQEYYERLLPKSDQPPAAAGGSGQDISALLAEEVAQLQNPKLKVFTYHKVGVAGLVYITMAPNAPGPGPPEILLAAAEDIKRTQKCKSRLCMRFTPVEMVGYAALNEMRRTAAKVVEPYFAGQEQPIKFSVQFDHRASAKLDRLEVINAVIESIKQPPHKVDLNDPELTIVVQVMKSVCTIGVARRFREFAKYNLRELVIPPEEKEATKEAQKAKAAAAAAAVAEQSGKEEAAAEGSSAKEADEPAEAQPEADAEGEAGAAEPEPAPAKEHAEQPDEPTDQPE